MSIPFNFSFWLPPKSVTFIGTQETTATQSSYTYSSVNIGGPGLIVIGFSGQRTSTTGSNLLSGITINGVSATIVGQVQEGVTPVPEIKPVTGLVYLRLQWFIKTIKLEIL